VSILISQSSPLANYLAHKDEIDLAITRVLKSGWYILGQEVAAFEREFAAYVGVAHAIGVGNGTDALHLALRACDVAPGEAVVTVSHTAVATVAAIEMCGATPVFADIHPEFFTMDAHHLEQAIAEFGKPIKAIVPVHLYGQPAPMIPIMSLAARYGLKVIEDCAQAHGAEWQAQRVGTFGDAAAFSFYPTKNLGALGDGGAVVTNNGTVAKRVRRLREYGWEQRYISRTRGVNSRLDELQAAILRIKLHHLDTENNRRIQLARRYSTALADHALLKLPAAAAEARHVYHQYVIRTAGRDDLQDYLRQHGTSTLIHYPKPIHQQPAYAHRFKLNTALPETETAAREILSLPLYPELTDEQVDTIVRQIKAWEHC
jgi:dTDP-4-amino-4,6-dideoxygalactose transaminase